jgi:proline iminopeptidase
LYEYYGTKSNTDQIYTNALIEIYYTTNRCFLEEGQLLRDIERIQDIPTIIVNGRYDIVFSPYMAYRPHKNLLKSKLLIVEEA